MIDKSKLLLDAAYEWERDHPDRVYMTQPTGDGRVVDYTWGQALDEARRMAAHLRSLELPPNSNIALISNNCAHFILCDLAIWMAGHATIALYPTLNADTVAYILDDSDSRLVFIGKLDNWDDMAPGVPADMPRIALPLAPPTDFPQWDELVAKQQPIADSPRREPDELCLICYTSGSTGRPKGVMHSFSSASIPAQAMSQQFVISADDRVLSYLPMAHVMERATVEFASFYAGTHIYFADRVDTFVEDLHRVQPTLFISVPRLWLKFQSGVFAKYPEQKLNRLLKIPIVGNMVRRKVLDGMGLGSVRVAASGSAPMPAELIEWYKKLGLNMLEAYGMTEDLGYSHMAKPDNCRAGFVGQVADMVQTRISEEGEIYIKSPGNMVGYYKQPELTAESYTEDGYFKTGDRGEYNDDGLLRITGRVKELFKTSKGKYVAPAPIENLLNSNARVELSCVSGLGRPACYAVIQLRGDLRAKAADHSFRQEVAPQLEAMLESINSQVERYEKVQFLAVVQEEWQAANNFLTPTLKIKRDVIEAAYEPFLNDWYSSEQKVIWQD